MKEEPLELLPIEIWIELQELFKQDWPQGITGFNTLETQREWVNRGLGYGFKVYCPFGDINNGMVGLNVKRACNEVIVLCLKNNTSKLEEALKSTKVIDWSNTSIKVPFAPPPVIGMMERLAKHFGKKFSTTYTDQFILDREKSPFEICLPAEAVFKELSTNHAELVESKWPHRYPGALWYFQLLIKANASYGLFINDELAAWMLVTETGFFTNLYTLEEHRRKGYAEIVLKLFSNIQKRNDREVFAFVVKGNENSFNLFTKLGFAKTGEVAWCFIENFKSEKVIGKL